MQCITQQETVFCNKKEKEKKERKNNLQLRVDRLVVIS